MKERGEKRRAGKGRRTKERGKERTGEKGREEKRETRSVRDTISIQLAAGLQPTSIGPCTNWGGISCNMQRTMVASKYRLGIQAQKKKYLMQLPHLEIMLFTWQQTHTIE